MLILYKAYPGCQRLSRGHITRLLCFLHLHRESSRQACRERTSGTQGISSSNRVMIPRCYSGKIFTILLCHFTGICHCSSNCDGVLISQAIYPSSMTNILTFTFVRTSCAQNVYLYN